MKKYKTISKGKNKRTASAVILVLEGETEQNFFRTLKTVCDLRYKIYIERRSKISSIEEVSKSVQKKFQTTKNDQIFFIYDLETSDIELDKLTFKDGQKYIPKDNVFISNSCFETFLVSYFKEMVTDIGADKLKNLLSKKLCKEYTKGLDYDFTSFIEEYVLKCESRIDKEYISDINAPFSNVNKLVDILLARK